MSSDAPAGTVTHPSVVVGPSNTGTHVAWQSAFWALAAIAANTCLQESGSIWEIPAEVGLIVRSSPVVCVIDTLTVWIQFSYYLAKSGPKEAIRIIANSREQHGTNGDEEAWSIHRTVGRCLLLLLALLQALKLYSLQGIPWTQAFGTMYLLFYVTNAIINTCGRLDALPFSTQVHLKRDDIFPSENLRSVLATITAGLQVFLWMWILRYAIPETWQDSLVSSICTNALTVVPFLILVAMLMFLTSGLLGCLYVLDFAILLLPSIVTLKAAYALVHAWRPSLECHVADALECDVKVLSRAIELTTCLAGLIVELCWLRELPVSTSFLVYGIDSTFRPVGAYLENWDNIRPYGLAFLLLLVSAVVSHLVYRVLSWASLARKLGLSKHGLSSSTDWICIYVFFANLGLALLYYAHVYSPTGTHKPAWTDNLGRLMY